MAVAGRDRAVVGRLCVWAQAQPGVGTEFHVALAILVGKPLAAAALEVANQPDLLALVVDIEGECPVMYQFQQDLAACRQIEAGEVLFQLFERRQPFGERIVVGMRQAGEQQGGQRTVGEQADGRALCRDRKSVV